MIVLPDAAAQSARYRHALRRVAEEHYDWQPVAQRLHTLLQQTSA